MIRPRGHRYATLALVMLGLACGDAPTAPNDATETVRVSLVGLGSSDAGAVLHLIGSVSQIQPAAAALDVVWVADGPSSATVVLVGPLSESGDVLLVRRPAGGEPLRAEVRELAGADGTVSSTSAARAIVRAAATP
jgi:hypothetical protein